MNPTDIITQCDEDQITNDKISPMKTQKHQTLPNEDERKNRYVPPTLISDFNSSKPFSKPTRTLVTIEYKSNSNGTQISEEFDSTVQLKERFPAIFGQTEEFSIKFHESDISTIEEITGYLNSKANIVFKESVWFPNLDKKSILDSIYYGAGIGASSGSVVGGAIGFFGSISATILNPLAIPIVGMSSLGIAIAGGLVGAGIGVLGGLTYSVIDSALNYRTRVDGKVLKMKPLSFQYFDLSVSPKSSDEEEENKLSSNYAEFA